MPLRPGELIAGKYRVERKLGSGGMGTIVAARHLELDEVFALKVMHPEDAAQPVLVQRFTREARAAVKLKGPHVARVMDVGRLASGAPFIVMERLTGEDLRAVLDRRGPLPPEEAAGYMLQACEAVAEAHACGIVHRDLKPGNLFLAEQPAGETIIKVLDFGISKMQSREDAAKDTGLTKSHAMLGSVRYMSPEQMRSSRDVDHRTDIWSLGVTLFELLTGRPPFTGRTPHEVSAQVLRDEAPRCRTLRPDVPDALDEVVMRCLEKDPAARFATAGELAERLAPFAPPAARSRLDHILRLSARVTVVPTPAEESGASPGDPAEQTLAPTEIEEPVGGVREPGIDTTDTSAEVVRPPETGRRSRAALGLASVLVVTVTGAAALWSSLGAQESGALPAASSTGALSVQPVAAPGTVTSAVGAASAPYPEISSAAPSTTATAAASSAAPVPAARAGQKSAFPAATQAPPAKTPPATSGTAAKGAGSAAPVPPAPERDIEGPRK